MCSKTRNLPRGVTIVEQKFMTPCCKASGRKELLVDIALLQTCRIIYFETSALPLRLTVLHDCSGYFGRIRHRILRMTARNVLDLNKVDLTLGTSLQELQLLSRLPQFQPCHLVLRMNYGNFESDLSAAQHGLPMTGTWPTSLESVTLILSARLVDRTLWEHVIGSLFPLEIRLNEDLILKQKSQAAYSATNHTMTIVLREVCTVADQEEIVSAHARPFRKVSPHLNHISDIYQTFHAHGCDGTNFQKLFPINNNIT
jgi:hypothetical protein